MKTINKFLESEFSKQLMIESIRIVNKWSSIHADNMANDTKFIQKNLTFESVGTNDERNYYQKTEKFLAIQSTLDDLNKVFIFLEIERDKIIEIYPKINSQEGYFKYHIENYIIRIYTIIDLVGKLGNLLYETNILDDDCNCYKFKEKVKKENVEIGGILEDILKYVDEIKKRRHTKIHTGEVEIEELIGISFWEDFSNFLPKEFDFNNSILKAMNEDRINDMINGLHSFLDLLIVKINNFLDMSINKL